LGLKNSNSTRIRIVFQYSIVIVVISVRFSLAKKTRLFPNLTFRYFLFYTQNNS